MKRSRIANLFTFAVFALSMWGQTANSRDPNHPWSGTTFNRQYRQGSPAMGGVPMTNMMGMVGPSLATIGHVEGRIALGTELNITEAQVSAWNAFEGELRANAKKLGEVRASMMRQLRARRQPAPTMAEHLDLQEGL